MSTLTALQILGLDRKAISALKRKAKVSGQTTPQYVKGLIQKGLELDDLTFDEILKPVREDFRRSGMTEDELDELITRARKATARKKTRNGRR